MNVKIANIAVIVVSVLYPFLVWIGTTHWEPRWVSLFLLAVLLARLVAFKKEKSIFVMTAGGVILMAIALWQNAALPLKFYPVLVNVALFLLFGASLLFPPTMIERFARLKEKTLSERAITYTRRVTQVWCVFFVANGAAALYTALYTSDAVWSLYNGFIAYLLIGLLFLIEYGVRLRVKKEEARRHAGNNEGDNRVGQC